MRKENRNAVTKQEVRKFLYPTPPVINSRGRKEGKKMVVESQDCVFRSMIVDQEADTLETLARLLKMMPVAHGEQENESQQADCKGNVKHFTFQRALKLGVVSLRGEYHLWLKSQRKLSKFKKVNYSWRYV